MGSGSVPVILVHGWNSHPGAWKQLVLRLEGAGIPYALFDHTGMQNANLEKRAEMLGRFLSMWRDESDCSGPVDLVCHSVGTCIARYFLEVCDGKRKNEQVRQLIGLGPPNTGSALAELFVDPIRGPGVIKLLTGIFVPEGFDPAADAIVQDVRPGSPFMEKLRSAGIRPDITYRIIVTANPEGGTAFFPLFEGKTWEMTGMKRFRKTLEGDGIVAHAESVLPGVSLDTIPASGGQSRHHLPADQFCHINLTKNLLVNDRILLYLTNPFTE